LTWYPTLAKPRFTPPDWVFAPVWFSLYIVMGIAAFLVWRKGFDRKEVRIALILFAIQLVLNPLWFFFFFGLKSPLAGLIEIFTLGIAIILTIRAFLQVSSAATFLFILYFLWVCFATGLNLSIWFLNQDFICL
jgi:tryptophan-rich sensory protein